MKGEVLPAFSRWSGIPTKPVDSMPPVEEIAQSVMLGLERALGLKPEPVGGARLGLPLPHAIAVPGRFEGYYPGYSRESVRKKNLLTWTILKAHTQNRGGFVRLRTADPRDVPEINFKYFDEGTDGAGTDLEAVVDGVEFVRKICAHNRAIKAEIIPGPQVGTREEIARFVRDHAWGHHASCSNPMGRASDPNAVVDSTFSVIGVQNLRVVDASVFPRIPGFFIVTPIYMIAEKASEIILDKARGG